VKFSIFRKQPWLITPDALETMASSQLAFLDHPSSLQTKESHPLLSVEDGIGVISICGPMLRRPDPLSVLIFGATDTEEIARAIREAVEREDVQAVFLDIDSPGGTVNGTPELAQTVADASRQKYVYAFTAGQMCSAAYWVASQCDAIYCSSSARVGSIGVILPVVDSSEAFRQEGLKIEVFAAGKFKSAGTPGTSLTEEQREWLQSDVNEIATDFKAAVLAKGRKIPDEAMEGQTFSARNAQRFNLAGAIKDRATAIARLRSLHVRKVDTVVRVMTIEDQLNAALERVQKLEADAAAREALLAEASQQADELRSQIERQTASLASLTQERDQLKNDLATARQSIESITAKNAQLESREQDLAKRASVEAARIVAETGTSVPAQVTPQGDSQSEGLLERFNAITDPKEQTVFWRNLTPQQKAFILNAQ
jgi:signal peptide peptidase SppA